jgi:hypothetical protein
MVERIRFLVGHVLSSIMVLSDFLLRHIAHFQSRVCPMWQYTGEGDATRLEHDQGSNLAPDMQRALLGKLSPDQSSADFTTLPPVCTPLCSNQGTMRRLLQELPTLDEIGIAAWQKGNKSRGVQIPGADVAGGPDAPSVGPGSSKGKGKVATPVRSDDEVSPDDDHPLQRRRLLHSGEYPIDGPPPTWQQAPAAISIPRLDSSAMTSLVAAPRTSSAIDEEAVVSRAVVEKEVTDVAVVKKATDDAAVAEKAATDHRVTDAAAGEKATSDTWLSPLRLWWRELRGLSY